MEDRDILSLYNARSESAITHTAEKYGNYCRSIAFRILQSDEDTEECVNDTYWRAWNTIPPQSPSCLRLFLGKITRNLSFDAFEKRRAEKRGSGQIPLILDELDDCIPSTDTVEIAVDERLLKEALNRFLASLPPTEKWIFMRRYWNADPIKEIARAGKMTENHVKVMLHRTRKKLKKALEKEGITI